MPTSATAVPDVFTVRAVCVVEQLLAVPGLLFAVSPDAKTTKNRLHIDLRPDDQEAEVERLVDMGARPVDIGQHDVGWVVLADPEGNEFCVLSSRKPAGQ